jgi:hypothetical protein
MNTPRFTACRRGPAVIIKGKVPVSPYAEGPHLLRVAEPRPDTRTFRLAYTRHTPTTMPDCGNLVLIVHTEPDVPEHVCRLRILLTNDQEFVIESRGASYPDRCHGSEDEP